MPHRFVVISFQYGPARLIVTIDKTGGWGGGENRGEASSKK